VLYSHGGKTFQRGKSEEQKGGKTVEQNFIPLDNETLTRLVYSHDDEITELTQQILYLIRKMEQIEENKK
jgi:hypothetical protein